MNKFLILGVLALTLSVYGESVTAPASSTPSKQEPVESADPGPYDDVDDDNIEGTDEENGEDSHPDDLQDEDFVDLDDEDSDA